LNPVHAKGYLFSGEATPTRVSYLCYYEGNYGSCVTQVPLLQKHIEEEIKEEIMADVSECFSALGQSFDAEGYTVNAQYTPGDYEVHLEPTRLVVDMTAQIALSKSGSQSVELCIFHSCIPLSSIIFWESLKESLMMKHPQRIVLLITFCISSIIPNIQSKSLVAWMQQKSIRSRTLILMSFFDLQ